MSQMGRPSYNVFMIGSFPPPISGMPIVNEQMKGAFASFCKVQSIDTAPDTQRTSVHYLGRILRWASAFPTALKLRLFGSRNFYASVDDAWGMFLNIWLIGWVRLLGFRIFLHHHSYRYIMQVRPLASLLVLIAGREATHIVLCEKMEADFRGVYPHVNQTAVCPNHVSAPDFTKDRLKTSGAPLVVGMLSNLTFEKGVDDFIQILEQGLEEGLNIRGVVAGPAGDQAVHNVITSAVNRLDGRLEWLGQVRGEAKEAFFRDIDIFVFPTKYRTEALPLVILESLVRGVPVISRSIGCIEYYKSLTGAKILDREENFTRGAEEYIRRCQSRPGVFARLKRATRISAVKQNEANKLAMLRLAERIASAERD
jgi:glycosyltransferase involved in cell wall biosynthesis